MTPPTSRCTGYRPILDAFSTFAKTGSAEAYTNSGTPAAGNGQKLCPSSGMPCDCAGANGAAADGGHANGGHANGTPANGGCATPAAAPACSDPGGCSKGSPGCDDGSTDALHPKSGPPEPIFPAELRSRIPPELRLPGPRTTWLRPTSLASLLAIKAKHPDAKLVVGNTEVGALGGCRGIGGAWAGLPGERGNSRLQCNGTARLWAVAERWRGWVGGMG